MAIKILTLDGMKYLTSKIKGWVTDGFVAKVDGKGLSSNDYTDAEKTKLAGIATGANKTTVDSALSSSSTNPVQNKVVNSALAGKQATLTAGTNITIDGTTISAKDTTYGTATTSANGLMSSSDKTKLNGVATGAQVNKIETVKVNGTALTVSSKAVNIDLSNYATKADVSAIPKYTTSVVDELPTSNISTSTIYLVPNEGSGTNAHDEYIYVDGVWELLGTTELDISGKQDKLTAGTNITISGTTISAKDTTYSVATTSANGLMSKDDKTKLNGIATGANKTVVDTALSSTSTNPVQNKVVNSALAGKLSTSGTAAKATADASGNVITDTYATKTEVQTIQDAADEKYVDLTSAQTIPGRKTFDNKVIINATSTSGNPDITLSETNELIGNVFARRNEITDSEDSNNEVAMKVTNGSTVGYIKLWAKADGSTFATAPTTPTTADSTEIATAGWVNDKLETYETKANAITGLSVSGKTVTYTKGDGTTGTITTQDTNTDTKVKQDVSTGNASYPVLLKNGTGTGSVTNTVIFDDAVTINPSTGLLTATKFKGTLEGNATSATKATQDGNGAVIADTYETKANAVTGLSVSGRTITYTKGDGSTGTITTQDTTTDTKNTTGTSNKTGTKLFLAGATSQGTNPVTYSNSNVYIGTDNKLYSGGKVVIASGDTATKATQDASGNVITDTYETKANAITGLSVSGKVITYTKGDGTTGTITTQDNNTDTKVTQTNSTGTSAYPILLKNGTGTGTVTNGVLFDDGVTIQPSTGTITATILDGKVHEDREDITGQTLDINTLNLSAGSPHIMRYIEKTSGGSNNITNIPVTGQPFILDVELIRWASTTDYVTMQRFVSVGAKANEYVRYDTSGTWSSWTKRVFTDNNTTYSVATSSANGLMSKEDKAKLDAVTASADAVSVTASLTSGTKVGTITINGTATDLYCEKNTDTNTKNTAGSTDSSSKLFLIGATSQAANPQTYSHDTAYVGTDGKLYSGGKVVIASGDTATAATKATQDASGNVITDTYETKANAITGLSVSGRTITYTKGDGTTGTITTQDNNTDTKNTTGTSNKTATKLFLAGATSQATNPVTYSNANVYIGTDNKLYSNGKVVIASGDTATAATKATQDGSGNVITSTYETKANAITGLSVSGKTITYTKGDGTTGTITTQDTNTTYSAMTGATSSAAGTAGLVPAPAAGKQTSFLRGDGTWVVPTNTTYGVATSSANGLMSSTDKAKLDAVTASADAVSFSRSLSSGTKIGTITINGTATDLYCETNTDTNTTYSNATTSAAGLMSASDKSKLDAITASADSVSISRSLTSGTKIGTITINGTATDLYCQTNTDTNTTYSAGTGLTLDGTTFKHSNSVTAQTSYVGSATAVPRLKFDAQGHITGVTTATIYPPTTVGTAGQVWVSDGSGAGAWKTLVTISTSDPSGGSNGDLWFKYE